MKEKKILKRAVVPLLLVGGMAIVSCTDSNYDLGKLDKTIALGSEQGLALPGNNSTKNLQLKDIFKLPDNGIVKVDEQTGDYVISEMDTPQGATVTIDPVEMSKDNETSDDYDYDISEIFSEILGARASHSASPTDEGLREIKQFTFTSATPEAIKSLTMARFNSTIDIKLDFSEDLIKSIDELKKLMVNVPNFFLLDVKVSQMKTDGSETPYPENVFNKQTNELTLTSFASNQRGVHVVIDLQGILFNQQSVRDKEYDYYLKMDEKTIDMKGGVKMQVSYEASAAAHSQHRAADNSLNIACTTKVGDITINGGEGKFRPEINLSNGLGNFAIGDLPDFLDDDEVSLRVRNPRIILNISNDINLKGIVRNARIVANMKDGSKRYVDVENFYINRHETSSAQQSTTTTIVVANDESSFEDIDTPYDYSSTVSESSGENLTDLIEDITDISTVGFECSAGTDENEEGEVELGHNYTVQPDFEFYAPLEFEAGSTIVYKDTIKGWHDDLKDLALTRDSYVEITADVKNELPMNLVVDVAPVEKLADGTLRRMSSDMFAVTVWTGDDESLGQNMVFAGSADNPRETHLSVRMKQTNDEAFSKIDGIIYRANGVTPESDLSETIKRNSYLKLENIGIFLKGKVVKDLDK